MAKSPASTTRASQPGQIDAPETAAPSARRTDEADSSGWTSPRLDVRDGLLVIILHATSPPRPDVDGPHRDVVRRAIGPGPMQDPGRCRVTAGCPGSPLRRAFRSDVSITWLAAVMHAAAEEIAAGRMTAEVAPGLLATSIRAAFLPPPDARG